MRLTDKYLQNYTPGTDCRITTFRNALAVHDIKFSNNMLLGISGCLIFGYNDGEFFSRVPYDIVLGISDQILEGLSSRLNVYLLKGRMINIDNAITVIENYLSQGIPINIAVNRDELLRIVHNHHEHSIFNAGHHYVTITSYNKSIDEFTLIDPGFSKKIIINKKQLEYIWFYDLFNLRDDIDPFQLCDGQWFSVWPNKKTEQGEIISSCFSGINKVLKNYFESPIPSLLGLNALFNLNTKLKDYVEKIDASTNDGIIKFIICLTIMNKVSGGGLGRKMYSYFLRELSETIDNKELFEISLNFTDLGILWTSFIKGLESGIVSIETSELDNIKISDCIKTTLAEVIKSEISCMENLDKWYRKNHVNYVN